MTRRRWLGAALLAIAVVLFAVLGLSRAGFDHPGLVLLSGVGFIAGVVLLAWPSSRRGTATGESRVS